MATPVDATELSFSQQKRIERTIAKEARALGRDLDPTDLENYCNMFFLDWDERAANHVMTRIEGYGEKVDFHAQLMANTYYSLLAQDRGMGMGL